MADKDFSTTLRGLKASNDIVDVIGRYISLSKKGTEYVGICPWHNDSKPSLAINRKKQVFTCPVCKDRSGDVIDFLKHMGYDDWSEIVEILGGSDVDRKVIEKRNIDKPVEDWLWNPELESIPEPGSITHKIHGAPSQVWYYKNAHEQIISVDCRFETAGGKIVLPYTYLINSKTKAGGWRWAAMKEPRLPYNYHAIKSDLGKTIIISEGCKTAKYIEDNVDTVVSTTWQGGSNAISKTDWSCLNGRRVIFWPDFDWAHEYGERTDKAGELMPWNEQPGNKAAMYVYDNFASGCEQFMFVHNPTDKPSGWDAADSGWGPSEMLKYIRQNIFEQPQKYNPNETETNSDNRRGESGSIHGEDTENEDAGGARYDFSQERVLDEDGAPENQLQTVSKINVQPNVEAYEYANVEDAQAPAASTGATRAVDSKKSDKKKLQNRYFRFVGYINADGKLTHCFYSFVTRTIIKLTSSNMGKGSSLFDLAPLSFWEASFPGEKSNFDGPSAVDWLVTTSKMAGMFKEDFIRGRGAWIDNGRVVVHSGDYLVVNGVMTPLGEFDSEYVYEQGKPLGFDSSSPLSKEESSLLLQLIKKFSWERDINAHLLAGWCVIAPVCGALHWRPHIWITGPAGSGKSWIFMNVVRHLVDKVGLFVQGSTTEAGLRQTLKRDALPVIFDEAEGESHADQMRMQGVLNFMRASSSEDGGNMLKGSQGGVAVGYSPRSCFAFASIGLQLNQQSDRTRVTILSLTSMGTKEAGRDRFKEIIEERRELMSGDFNQRLIARTVDMLPTIIANAKVFAEAGAVVLGGQRMGDQIGFLLAGAYSLVSDGEISYDDAIKWISDKDWNEEVSLQETRDELRLFQRIIEQEVQAEGNMGSGKFTRTVGELIRVWAGLDTDAHLEPIAAERALLRCGIKVTEHGEAIIISNSSKWIKSSLRDTPWVNNHGSILARIETSQKTPAPVRFASISQRGVIIPMEFFLRFGS